MQKKVCFSFFIFFAILSQGILAEFLEKDVEESSTYLVRQKRVINRMPGRDVTLLNGDLPYVANLKKFSVIHCVVTILSHRTVITAARCVANNTLHIYKVFAGSAFELSGTEHILTEIKLHGHNPSRTPAFLTGIALLTLNPPIVFNEHANSIGLHSGPVLTGMQAIVAGWGIRVGTGRVESRHASKLRLIGVPIMNHRECQNIYSRDFPITEEDVCTYHPQKLCADNDAGAPLLIDHQLAGIHIGGIRTACSTKPDVFVLLQSLNYGPWIVNNIVH